MFSEYTLTTIFLFAEFAANFLSPLILKDDEML